HCLQKELMPSSPYLEGSDDNGVTALTMLLFSGRHSDSDTPILLRMTDFSSLPLSASLLRAIDALGYAQMTPVQQQGLPPVLAGRDAIVQAPTGSGKTVAFGLGLLNRLDPALIKTQAL